MKKLSVILLLSLVIVLAYYFGGLSTDDRALKVKALVPSKPTKLAIPKIELPEVKSEFPPVETLDSVTAQVVGFDASLSLDQRSSLVWRLFKRELRKNDFQAIYAFLKSYPETEERQQHYHSLKNDLLVTLIDDGRFKESTGQIMLEIINDRQQHEVMREYVLQYVTDYFEKHWLDPQKLNSMSDYDNLLQQSFLDTMWEMVSSNEGPIAGTSLIRLHDLSKNFDIVGQEKVDGVAKWMAIDSTVPPSSRMAALSIISEKKIVEVASDVRFMAFDSSLNIPLRMSALNTIGKLNPDKSLVDQIQKEILNDKSSSKYLKAKALEVMKICEKEGDI